MTDGITVRVFFGTLLAIGAVTLTGCEPAGPAQRAGESIDKGVQQTKDAINPPGDLEKAGRKIDKAMKP